MPQLTVMVMPVMRWGVHAYSSDDYNFVKLIEQIFDVGDLARLGADALKKVDLLRAGAEQSTRYHRRFYAAFQGRLEATYRDFVSNVATAVLDTRHICYQTIPTFRIHLPGNVAVGAFHRDKDYNHQNGEVNFWLPLTPAWDTNTVWIETTPDRGDYQPVDLLPGQFFVFDGVNLRHGNRLNTTGSTRASFDFRCLPLRWYRDTGLRSVNAGRRMSIGDYFSVL